MWTMREETRKVMCAIIYEVNGLYKPLHKFIGVSTLCTSYKYLALPYPSLLLRLPPPPSHFLSLCLSVYIFLFISASSPSLPLFSLSSISSPKPHPAASYLSYIMESGVHFPSECAEQHEGKLQRPKVCSNPVK